MQASGRFRLAAAMALSGALLIATTALAQAPAEDQDSASQAASVQQTQPHLETGSSQPRFLVKPLQAGNMETIRQQAASGAGLKMWTYNVKSTRSGSSGKSYSGVMVGNSPLSTNGTTSTTVYVVPLIVKIGGKTFNSTVADQACLAGKVPDTVLAGSPMVAATHDFKVNGVDVGAGQYTDAFQRANFWKSVSANGGTYHNKLAYKFLPGVTVTPPAASSHLFSVTGGCIASYGGIDINWLDTYLTGILIPQLAAKGVGPANLPIFMLYNTTLYDSSPSNCCIGGYHGAGGSPVQTYSAFQFDIAGVFGTGGEDVNILSHEIAEWEDDPLGINPTPAWGHTGQVSTCQNNLEVGDPLSGSAYPAVTMNGYTYHLQELAFFSWFYGGPSVGAGGKFSDNGTFAAAQGACR
jgi:hypothetical protein